MNSTPLSSGDHRLTALACGEITDAAETAALREMIASDPNLQREFAEICALQEMLQTEFSQETEAENFSVTAEKTIPFSQPKKTTVTAEQRPRRYRRGWGGGGILFERKESVTSRVIRYTLGAGVTLGVAAALVLAVKTPSPSPENFSEKTTVTANNAPSEIRLQLASPRTETGDAFSPQPNRRIAVKGGGESALMALVTQLPVHIPGGGENAFVQNAHAQTIPLNLVTAGKSYAQRLQTHLTSGRLPARDHLRIDGMVNAFLAASPKTASPGISLEAEVVPAPWAEGHWLVRATILAGEIDGTIAANDARATVTFSSEQVSAWRMLGCEDGPAGAIALDVPGVVRSGEMLTTLFELRPSPAAKTGDAIGEMKIVFVAKNGARTEVTQKINYPASDGLRTASDATRFAAAIATFGLVVRDSQYRGTASLSLANTLAADVTNDGKPLFIELLREVAPLVR